MNRFISRVARPTLRRAKKLVKSSNTIRNLLADGDNVQEFTDLYEHERMLADSVRVNTYAAAIKRYIDQSAVVIDLGTGTGILSLLAAAQGAKRIYAIDHSPIIELAQAAARHNGLDSEQIVFVHSNSRNFTAGEQVDAILHEQIGDELFDENMIENILDLKRRMLRPGGRIIPGRFELYLEPVRINDYHRVLYIWEEPVAGIDFSFLRNSPLASRFQKHKYQVPFLPAGAVGCFLATPRPLLTFDLNEMASTEELPTEMEAVRPATQPGRMDGFALYFKVIFDDEIGFDTSPLNRPTSWGNRLIRQPSRYYSVGEEIKYRLTLADILRVATWRVELIS